MTPFINYENEVRRIWRNIRRRYARYVRYMTERKAARQSYVNIVPLASWLVGRIVEDTYLDVEVTNKGHRMAVRQRFAERTLPSPQELAARGIDPERLYDELATYVSKRLGVEVVLVEAISYSGADDGEDDRDTRRFVKKRVKRGWQ